MIVGKLREVINNLPDSVEIRVASETTDKLDLQLDGTIKNTDTVVDIQAINYSINGKSGGYLIISYE